LIVKNQTAIDCLQFRPNQSIDRRVIAFPTFSNMAAVHHLYDFASLAGKCLTTPLFGGLGGLNPSKLCVVIKTPKRHILGWWRVI